MKKNLLLYRWLTNRAAVGLLGGLSLLMGCASTPTTETTGAKVPPLPAGVTLHQDKNIQGVWLAEGFDLKGYDTLYITPPVFAAIERPNETEMRATAMRVLPEQLGDRLRDTRLFNTITTRAEEVKPDVKSLRLQNTIIEYERGGGAGRFFAGVFGGGQPVIKVRGQILDGDKLMCVYELRRSGESADAKLTGVGMSDEEIQRDDIRILAGDLADFFKRTAKMD
jgi:hypothetical protein